MKNRKVGRAPPPGCGGGRGVDDVFSSPIAHRAGVENGVSYSPMAQKVGSSNGAQGITRLCARKGRSPGPDDARPHRAASFTPMRERLQRIPGKREGEEGVKAL